MSAMRTSSHVLLGAVGPGLTVPCWEPSLRSIKKIYMKEEKKYFSIIVMVALKSTVFFLFFLFLNFFSFSSVVRLPRSRLSWTICFW